MCDCFISVSPELLNGTELMFSDGVVESCFDPLRSLIQYIQIKQSHLVLAGLLLENTLVDFTVDRTFQLIRYSHHRSDRLDKRIPVVVNKLGCFLEENTNALNGHNTIVIFI